MTSLVSQVEITKIENISPENGFTEFEKKSINTFIKLIEKKNDENDIYFKITQALLCIGVVKNDVGLVEWALNNDAKPNVPFTNIQFNIIRMMGFHLTELENESNENTNNNTPLSESVINNLNEKVFNSNEDSMDNCAICTEKFNNSECIIKLSCDHSYHKEHILTWFTRSNTCPLCRIVVE
jgi:hypothetical protein